jgi:hypothetical protein
MIQKKMHRINIKFFLLICLICHNPTKTFAQYSTKAINGISEKTPSKAIYFDWINRNWYGSNENKIEANLKFFKWLHDEYGMQLDIYLMDAADIDQGPLCASDPGLPAYGSLETPWFRKRFPHGFGPLADLAESFGCRLGVWLGPDGYGTSETEAQTRKEMLVKFCQEYNFALFKFDACCSDLSPENQKYFIETMEECRKYSPDLIVLNHRITLNEKARKQTTTFLWEGRETYVDVNISNDTPAPHHRASNLNRGLPPELNRLTEDHGVCLSSAINAWDDDLILQAFNRNLILSPEIYGNPFLLHDEAFPRLARIYNIHRLYNDIMVNGMTLPEERYGKFAVSRGDSSTRLITLRNLSWQSNQISIKLDESVGLLNHGDVEVLQYHPVEKFLGSYKFGSEVDIIVLPFRSCLIKLSTRPNPEILLKGSAYQVIKKVPGQPVLINVLGSAGEKVTLSLTDIKQNYTKASLNGKDISSILSGRQSTFTFPGMKKKLKYLTKVGDMQLSPLPVNPEKYMETCYFALDNNALEVRELQISGETRFATVQACRDAFFKDTLFSGIGVWDKYAFDNILNTDFRVRLYDYLKLQQNDGTLRLDMGEVRALDSMIIKGVPANYAPETVELSSDLSIWNPVKYRCINGEMNLDLNKNTSFRYLRFDKSPSKVAEIEGFSNHKAVDRKRWKASNLFSFVRQNSAKLCWRYEGTLVGTGKSAYISVTVPANCSEGSVFACMLVDGKIIAANDRSPSFPYNNWEHFGIADKNLTLYIPVSEDLEGRTVQLMLISTDGKLQEVKPEVWLCNPKIYEKAELKLQ